VSLFLDILSCHDVSWRGSSTTRHWSTLPYLLAKDSLLASQGFLPYLTYRRHDQDATAHLLASTVNIKPCMVSAARYEISRPRRRPWRQSRLKTLTRLMMWGVAGQGQEDGSLARAPAMAPERESGGGGGGTAAALSKIDLLQARYLAVASPSLHTCRRCLPSHTHTHCSLLRPQADSRSLAPHAPNAQLSMQPALVAIKGAEGANGARRRRQMHSCNHRQM